jgi:hypothetical protein
MGQGWAMPKIIDLAGQRFGRLLVVECLGIKNRGRVWQCRCDCGRRTKVRASNLRSGNTKSCGCVKREAGCRNLLSSARRCPRNDSGRAFHPPACSGLGNPLPAAGDSPSPSPWP